MFKRSMLSLLLVGSLAGAPFILGCDKEVAKTEKTTTSSDGTMKKETETVKEKADGTVTKEKTSSTDKQ